MVAYNFQSQFAEDVASGKKAQTIRAEGKRKHARLGDKLQLYTGMMSKSCRKLVEPDPACRESFHVRLERRGRRDKPKVMIVKGPGWVDLSKADALELARADGFSSVEEMIRFFEDTYCLPFEGVCIKW